MADSFADLWNSSAPSSSKQKDHATLQKLGSSLPNKSSHPAIRRPGHPQSDLFSMLASASAVSPGNTKSTSETMSRLTGSPQPQAQSRSGTPSDRPLAKTESMDAFGSLLGSSFTSYAKNSDFGKVTLADHDIRTTNSVTPIHNNKTEGVDVWRGLDTLGSANTPAPKGLRNDVEDFLGIGASGTGAGSGSPNRHIPPANVLDDDDWGLSDFAATHVPTGSNENRSLAQSQSSGYPGVESAVGSSGRGLGHGNEVGDDAEANLLGDFGEPRTKKSGPYPHSLTSGSAPTPLQSTIRTASPPPHVVGQIVEMGFSPQQARIALVATDSGVDVQQALEMLLQDGATSDLEGVTASEDDRNRLSDNDESVKYDATLNGRRGFATTSQLYHSTHGPSTPGTTKELQERADKLLAQASEIGLSMFNRANVFWKEGKEKVQKAYEERTSVVPQASTSARGQNTSSRPRWLDRATEERGEDDWGLGSPVSHVKHATNSEVATESRSRLPNPSKSTRNANLLGDDEPVYSSPSRRKTGGTVTTSSTIQHAPQVEPTLRERVPVSATPSALASYRTHKGKGTEMFKLGRYAEADSCYGSALSTLPDQHLLRVPVYTNRALARIRCGDHTGAVEDCTAALEIIGIDYHPAQEVRVTREECGAEVDIGVVFIKAYRRRAEAYEGKEKWELARKDWEAVVALDWVGKERIDAVNGVTRCRKMENLNSEPRQNPATKDSITSQSHTSTPIPGTTKRNPRNPVFKPPIFSQSQTFEAVAALRAANSALEAEEQQRHELKDSVDSRLSAWKAGKETNLRALLASLDTVLWEGLNWKSVGMAELVNPAQVKARYTRAIAKVHPDKLNPRNTTVEQRMIANGVFAVLNEAWAAFTQ